MNLCLYLAARSVSKCFHYRMPALMLRLLRKAQLAESSGYALNDKGKLCIQGYMDLGSVGGVAIRQDLRSQSTG